MTATIAAAAMRMPLIDIDDGIPPAGPGPGGPDGWPGEGGLEG
jgi:hypothetical protein